MIYYILGIIIGSLLIATSIGISSYFFFKNNGVKKLIKKIGRTAEETINEDIKIWARHTSSKFWPSTLFKYSDNKVFEVDSILITKKALYVIEIKSIKGTIEGDVKDPYWTKVLGENRFKVTNPIIQNDKHIKHIINMTGIKVPTISLIVFSSRTEKLIIENTPSYAAIIRHPELFDTLDSIENAIDGEIYSDNRKQLIASINNFKTKKREDINLHKHITSGKAGR